MRAAVGVLAVFCVVLLGGCDTHGGKAHATVDHPNGCHLFNEGPAVPLHPVAGPIPASFTLLLRQPFQTALSTALSPDAATTGDPRVVQVEDVRHASNGQTYTMFQAVGLGTTTVRAVRRATTTTQAAALLLTVTVRC